MKRNTSKNVVRPQLGTTMSKSFSLLYILNNDQLTGKVYFTIGGNHEFGSMPE